MRQYLVNLRAKNKMSQQDVASKLCITRQYYQQIESGERQKRPDVSLLSSIGEIYGLSLTEMADLELKCDMEQSSVAKQRTNEVR